MRFLNFYPSQQKQFAAGKTVRLFGEVRLIELHLTQQTGVATHHLADGSHRCRMIAVWIKAEPQLARINAHHLITRDGTANMCAYITYAWNSTQFIAGLPNAPVHLRTRSARSSNPVHQNLTLFQLRQP